jgi:phosphocarrier protein HPr
MPASSEQVELPVRLTVPLHARPAGRVVRAAAGFAATVELWHGQRHASARGILALLALGAGTGATVLVRATGPDARAAAEAVCAALAEGA